MAECQTFADDALIHAQGDDVYVLLEHVQVALNAAHAWTQRNGLTLSPTKTVLMVLTRKIDFPEFLPPIYLDNRELTVVKQMKYLGVIIDSRLSFSAHVTFKVAQAKRILMMAKRSLGFHLWPGSQTYAMDVYRGS